MIFIFRFALICFAIVSYPIKNYLCCLDALHLEAVEFDWRLAAEHVDQHLELALSCVNLAYTAVKALERSVDDVDDLAQIEVDLVLRLLQTHTFLNLLDFFGFDRGRVGAAAHETGDAGRIAHDVPGVLTQLHVHQDVALEDALLDDAALAVLDLDHLFLRHEDLEDLVAHI